ncbi:MAG: methylated-DNA--[protein]-cysteine S-methyltransferase [Cyanobacteria bacterium TGS_CYA1]|nr:methylated-DNA--[protein]-cysteine S-methyltransferase [Cyanobacteria bacterium TGS_CYA1]
MPNTSQNHIRYRICSDEPEWVGELKRCIVSYFDGDAQALNHTSKINLDYSDITLFRRNVYESLRKTKPGERISYAHLAAQAGAPGAARAVGRAMAKNPFPLLIPCHRVIKSDGSSGGYSALSGTKSKEELLKMELNPHPERRYKSLSKGKK